MYSTVHCIQMCSTLYAGVLHSVLHAGVLHSALLNVQCNHEILLASDIDTDRTLYYFSEEAQTLINWNCISVLLFLIQLATLFRIRG